MFWTGVEQNIQHCSSSSLGLNVKSQTQIYSDASASVSNSAFRMQVLIHAAAGGVGLAGLAVLASEGIKAIATAGSVSKRQLLRTAYGVKTVANSRDASFLDPLAVLGGPTSVLNSLTSPGMVAASIAALRIGGRFVEIGKRDIWSPARVAQERPDVSYNLVRLPTSAFLRTPTMSSIVDFVTLWCHCDFSLFDAASPALKNRKLGSLSRTYRCGVSTRIPDPLLHPCSHSVAHILDGL